MNKLIFDPTQTPIVSISDEPAIAPDRLRPDRLRAGLAESSVVWHPELTHDARLLQQDREPTPAAVLVPVVLRAEGPSILLTQRTAHLHDHAGQVSFPGGRTEESDRGPVDTALRETEEEIGLDRRHVETIGHLPEYFTVTGYRVTPVVSLIAPPFTLTPDPFEVAEIFEVPLAFLMDPANHQLRTIPDQSGRTFYAMPYDRFFIWGATAAMLRNLYRLLAARLP